MKKLLYVRHPAIIRAHMNRYATILSQLLIILTSDMHAMRTINSLAMIHPSITRYSDRQLSPLFSRLKMHNGTKDAGVYPIDPLLLHGTDGKQSMTPDIAYYYLRNTIGLSEETMWKVTLEAGSVLGMTPSNLKNKVSLLRRTMNLSDEDIRTILNKQPAILHYSAEKNLAPTILFLVRALDLSKSELRSIVVECPSVLGYSLDNLSAKISFFMNTLGYNTGDTDDGKEKVRQLFLKVPKVILCAVDTGLVPRMKFFHKELLFTLSELRTLYMKNPRLLIYGLDDNLREKIVFFFILQLQFELEQVRKMVLAYPLIMDYSLENHMKPIVEYFLIELDFSANELRSIILKCPRIFTNSLSKIKYLVGLLRYELSLDALQVKRVLFQAPQILGLSMDRSLKKKLDFLKQRLDLTEEELGSVISKMPTILSLGVSTNLLPKLEYLEEALHRKNDYGTPTISTVKLAVMKQPTLLGYSLTGRIQPRMEQLISAGIEANKITVGISMSNDKFNEWLCSSHEKKMSKDAISQWNSTAVGFLCDSLGFTHDDIQMIFSQLPYFSNFSLVKLRSRVSYLKKTLNTSNDELKKIIQKNPMLLDVSLKHDVGRRLNQLRYVGLSLFDNIESLEWLKDKFDKWISSEVQRFKSDIGFIKRTLGFNITETQSLLSKIPELEYTRNRDGLRQKLKYLKVEFNTSDVKLLICHSPEVLNLSFKKTIKPRVEKMRLVGMPDPHIASMLLLMSEDEFRNWWKPQHDERFLVVSKKESSKIITYLKNTLQLQPKELDAALLKLHERSVSHDNAIQIISFLLLHCNDLLKVKSILMKNPHTLSFDCIYLENRTRNRFEALADFDKSNLDTISMIIMTDNAFEKFLCKKQNERQQNININSMKEMLKAVLHFQEHDIHFFMPRIIRESRNDPDKCLLPKLNFLLSKFCGSKELVATCLRENPYLLNRSLEKWILPRIALLNHTDLSLYEASKLFRLTDNEIHQRKKLQTLLNLTSFEVDRILPIKLWLKQLRFRRSIVSKIEYLMSYWNISKLDMKNILLDDPSVSYLSLSKKIKLHMGLLSKYGYNHSQISDIFPLSSSEAENYLLRQYFCCELNFTHQEVDQVFLTLMSHQRLLGDLHQKVNYLLNQAFSGAKEELKGSIIENPTLLRKSFKYTIQPRVETLHLLKSVDIQFIPNDMGKFLSQQKASYEKALAPSIKTWHPNDINLDYNIGKNDTLSVLQGYDSSLIFASYQDFNRESANIVNWY